MPRNAGKYRYRVVIEKYSASTDVYETYGNAWAKIEVTGGELANDEDKTKGTRSYTVSTPYNPSLTIGTTGYRFNWTVQSATRYLYIRWIDNDSMTFQEESIFQCEETVR
jgi:hypothetical protein